MKMKLRMNPFLICSLLLMAPVLWAGSFTTDGNGIRDVVSATINGSGALYVSEIDGAVSCYTPAGIKLWRHPTEDPAVLFELSAADIDGDGSDDLLAAGGDGHVSLWGADGRLLWKFTPGKKVRFSAVTSVTNDGKTQIFAGGNDCVLYELDPQGRLVSQTSFDGIITRLKGGNFLQKERQTLFIMTMRSDKWGWDYMGILDPETKKALQTADAKAPALNPFKTLMINETTVADVDGDGLDDLMFLGTGKVDGVFVAARDAAGQLIVLSGRMQPLLQFGFPKKDNQLYAHAFAASLQPVRKEIAVNYGTVLYAVDLKGHLLGRTGTAYNGFAFNGLTVNPATRQLFGNGQLGGGTTLQAFDLTKDDWWNTPQQLLGRLAEVEENLNTLYRQALRFKRPSYQRKPAEPWVLITGKEPVEEVRKLTGADLQLVKLSTFSEDFDRSEIVASIGKEALKKDRRKPYNLSRDEIVARVKKYEKDETPFTLWAGHGTDPFYMSVETMEAVLEAAPTTCYGFIYAEMANSNDPRSHYFVNHYVPRLAVAMRKQGRAKFFFRYKNIFWAANAHLPPWNDLFFSGKYSDLMVPSTEDTNSRTQDINLAGRVGMFAGGYVNDFALRLVEDNVTSWRPESACGQTSISPFLRSGVLRAAYGARFGIISGLKFQQKPGIQILYALMKSGALPQVKREDLLSIGSWLLLQDVDQKHIEQMDEGHDVTTCSQEDTRAVISTGGVGWSGGSLPEYDYSRVALGVNYRWLNFIPELPCGMVPIAPISAQARLKENGIPFSVSDTKDGFLNGEKIPAVDFGKSMAETVLAGAAKMPILVKGAAWSAIRLDSRHVRLILIDPGYVDPQAREAVISFSGSRPASARDILSKEKVDLSASPLILTVPAGSLRLIDLTY